MESYLVSLLLLISFTLWFQRSIKDHVFGAEIVDLQFIVKSLTETSKSGNEHKKSSPCQESNTTLTVWLSKHLLVMQKILLNAYL